MALHPDVLKELTKALPPKPGASSSRPRWRFPPSPWPLATPRAKSSSGIARLVRWTTSCPPAAGTCGTASATPSSAHLTGLRAGGLSFSAKAVLILDGLSLRELPWLLQGAKERGFKLHEVSASASELPGGDERICSRPRLRQPQSASEQWWWLGASLAARAN